MLNYAKLVKKMVHVRGKNGKIFTRMQWVSPEQASTGHGVRQINDMKGYKKALEDGLGAHPDFHEAMKDQGVDMTQHKPEHPHFFLPETEESKRKWNKRLLGEDHDMDKFDENFNKESPHHMHHSHDMPVAFHKVHGEYDFVPKEEIHGSDKEDFDEDKFKQEHGIHPEIHEMLKGLEEHLSDEEEYSSPYGILSGASGYLDENHWGTIKKHIEDHIRDTVKDDTFVRNVQLGALKDGDMRHKFFAGAHPATAKAVVDKALGESLANKFRKDLDSANLSINFPGKHEDSIKNNGYAASTIDSYIENNFSDPDDIKEQVQDIIEDPDFDSERERIKALRDVDTNLYVRADAEHEAIGLNLEDRKPTYIALNPMNGEFGANTFYGNRWMKVDPSVLNHCTATMDDSFNTSNSFAKIWDMDHLKNIFIMKMIDKHPDMTQIKKWGEGGYTEWHAYAGEIPIELQYHQPKLNTDQFEIMPDASKHPEFYHGESKDGNGWDEKYGGEDAVIDHFDDVAKQLGIQNDEIKGGSLYDHMENGGKLSAWIADNMPERLHDHDGDNDGNESTPEGWNDLDLSDDDDLEDLDLDDDDLEDLDLDGLDDLDTDDDDLSWDDILGDEKDKQEV